MAKPRTKHVPKGKKAEAHTTSKSSAGPPAKKNTPSSRSRSTSVLPGGSVGGDTPKAEKQEEEEDSGAENEDDKLYCVCKNKYDEDRFMIACDKYVNPSEFLFNFSLSVGAMNGIIHSV